MKLHSSLMTAVTETVYQIFHDQKMADKAIQHVLKSNKKWGSRDRAFIAENCYEMVRWWRLLHFINESRVNNLHPSTLMRLLGILLRMKGIDLPEWSEFKGLSRSHIKFRYDEAQKIRKVKESIPDWLDQLGADELGEKWESVLSSLNVTAPLTIRVNTLKTNYSQLAMALIPHGVKLHPIPDVPNAARVEERSNLFSLPEFKEGLFEVQDAGSQLIPMMTGVKPGLRVIDACAGAGGKSLQLACMMENKGAIIAMDIEEWKLEELKKRARRNGIHNIETRLITGKVIKRLRGSADVVLLDVPCSGLGVLRRNPDAKWKLQPSTIEELHSKQAEILQSYSSMVKDGGILVYATCSILPSENEKQVAAFLAKNPQFQLVEERWSDLSGGLMDGFYMARMARQDKQD